MIIRNEKDSITNGIIGGASEGVAKFYKLGSEFETQTAFAVGGTTNTFIENGKKYRCNTFKSPGNIVFPKAGNIEGLIVAGGGGGGFHPGGAAGGGAGGYRTMNGIGKFSQPVTVGAGGLKNFPGNDSSFLSIVSAGGGHGGQNHPAPVALQIGAPGGSGGGGGWAPGALQPAGLGNVPPVSPPQGNPGGADGGGGGAGGAGGRFSGGAGVTSSFTGTSITRCSGGTRSGTPGPSPADSGNGGRGLHQGGFPGEVSIRYRVS